LRCRVGYATGAAGVSPPWVLVPHLQLVAKVAGWLQAGVSPPWVRSVERSAWRAVNHLQLRLGNHGWLTPAALDCSTCVACEMCDLRCRVRICDRSSERQPAVGSGNALATATWHSSENLRAGTRSGDRQPAVAQNRIGNRNRSHTRDDRQPKQAWRPSARRGSVNRTLSGENRALFGDLATDEQQGDRQPALAQNPIGNRNRPHARGDRLLHKSGGRKPPVVQPTPVQA
jgi:hypothetical protein